MQPSNYARPNYIQQSQMAMPPAARRGPGKYHRDFHTLHRTPRTCPNTTR